MRGLAAIRAIGSEPLARHHAADRPRENHVLQDERFSSVDQPGAASRRFSPSRWPFDRDLLLLMYGASRRQRRRDGTGTSPIGSLSRCWKSTTIRLMNVFRDALRSGDGDTAHGGDVPASLPLYGGHRCLLAGLLDGLRKAIRHQYRKAGNELRVASAFNSASPRSSRRFRLGAGRLVPALEVGGDYWSVKHYANDGVITCKLADVTATGLAPPSSSPR